MCVELTDQRLKKELALTDSGRIFSIEAKYWQSSAAVAALKNDGKSTPQNWKDDGNSRHQILHTASCGMRNSPQSQDR